MDVKETGVRHSNTPTRSGRPMPLLPAAIAVVLAYTATAGAADTTDPYVEGLIRAFESGARAATPLTLSEAIHAAVENNPGIRAARLGPRQDRLGHLEAASVYDPRLRLESSVTNEKIPTANALSGVSIGKQQPLTRDEVRADLTISKQFVTGTGVDLSWRNRRRSTNSQFQALVPEFQPELGVTLSQPLLNDFGGLAARSAVDTAANTSRRSAAAFEAALSDFVATVVDAYWNYTEAEAEVKVREHALELARELVSETQARVKIGTLPPVAAREARADEAARKEEAISARNRLDVAARTLQYTVMLAEQPGGPPLPVRPVERHEVHDAPLDRTASLRIALEHRAEVRAARMDVENARIEERRARNALLPALNLVGNYTLLGLGGIARNVQSPTNNISVALAALASSETGAYDDALDALLSGDFYSYRIGLELDVPFSNAEARATYERARLAVRAAKNQLRQVISDVALEIESTVGDVASATQRVFAARMARELAEENLRNQKKRYEVGMVTTTDVLRFQDKVVAAMASEIHAVADHARAVSRLARAEGTLLERYDIRVDRGDPGALPLWARY